ncbi:MAG: hypothetical protein M2R45_01758 [Verrucomicrobia subdivision 3 bacterium]|nr:hypothetical protein [Limisphaerales bacterium]MCS1413495.1 hypothetical protein [Limisphaerales bacterium]
MIYRFVLAACRAGGVRFLGRGPRPPAQDARAAAGVEKNFAVARELVKELKRLPLGAASIGGAPRSARTSKEQNPTYQTRRAGERKEAFRSPKSSSILPSRQPIQRR